MGQNINFFDFISNVKYGFDFIFFMINILDKIYIIDNKAIVNGIFTALGFFPLQKHCMTLPNLHMKQSS